MPYSSFAMHQRNRNMNKLRTPAFHRFYLKITAVVVGIFGPVFFLGAMPSTAEPARWTLDFLSQPVDGLQQFDAPTTRFLSALTGGFLMGWGVCIWCLSEWVYPQAPDGVRKTVLASVLTWFVFDSGGSIVSGNSSNAVINCLVLLVAVGPLWQPAKNSE